MANANSITRGQFWGKLLVCVAVLACASAVAGTLTQQSVSRRIPADARSAEAAETIALENSLVRSGFNADEFAMALRSPGVHSAASNMAMGGSASTPAWEEYQQHLRELLAKQSVTVVDASCGFPTRINLAMRCT